MNLTRILDSVLVFINFLFIYVAMQVTEIFTEIIKSVVVAEISCSIFVPFPIKQLDIIFTTDFYFFIGKHVTTSETLSSA